MRHPRRHKRLRSHDDIRLLRQHYCVESQTHIGQVASTSHVTSLFGVEFECGYVPERSPRLRHHHQTETMFRV